MIIGATWKLNVKVKSKDGDGRAQNLTIYVFAENEQEATKNLHDALWAGMAYSHVEILTCTRFVTPVYNFRV